MSSGKPALLEQRGGCPGHVGIQGSVSVKAHSAVLLAVLLCGMLPLQM
jgi:hypothetical protein